MSLYLKRGRPQLIGLEARRFGNLTVLSFHGIRLRRTQWRCLCDCGKQTVVSGSSLITANTKSCGCLRGTVGMERDEGNGRLLRKKAAA